MQQTIFYKKNTIMLYRFKIPVVALIATISMACKQSARTIAEPFSIEVATAEGKKLPYTKEFIAPISANYSATVQPRISGFLVATSFKNGMPVKRGQLIFTLDDAPQRANRLAAEAALSSAKAKAAEAKQNYERAIPLARINAISQMQLDQYTAENLSAIASVKSAEQNLRNARLDEGYTRIYAPISGIISSSAATVGDYIGPGTQFSTLTTIQSIDTIGVDLAIPMSEYLAVSGRKAFSYNNASLLSNIRLRVADGSEYPEKGFYQYTRQSIASESGTIVLVVGFKNPDYALKVGQFARITASLGADREHIIIPQRAVSQIQNIASVWVIRPDSTAEYRKVQLGNTEGEWWIVESGVAKGEVVATTGLQKLRNGMKVSITNQQ
jgi:membrane fusion protein (multidrug efflux system)